MMNKQKGQFYFLLALLIFFCLITFFIFRPFIYVLVFAGVFAVIFKGLHRRILTATRQRTWLAAALTTIVIIFCILIPLSLVASQIFREINQLYFSLSAGSGQTGLIEVIQEALTKLQNLIPASFGFSFNLDQFARQAANWLINNIGSIFSNVASLFTGLFIFVIGLFYLLKDGHELKKDLIKYSPLSDEDDRTIFDKLELAINSVIKGNMFVALIQGVVATVGLTIFGVPNPFLWGAMAAVSALIPGMGTSLVTVPAIVYLFLISHIWQGIGMIIWAAIAVGAIDNFLGPKIVSRRIRMHPFIIFLSTIGGIAYFGIAGFILGPIIVSVLFTLFDIYFSFVNKTSE